MNRLQHETSPYLRQHADNPVDWYAWGDEALNAAKTQDKPILLSIGYSACHWCHVMAHESFEHEATARIMNDLYINIKVDREERPDLDDIYMQAVQTLTGSGGWPMTVFLTPDARPFYGGTYFPPEPRYGMPSFRQLLVGVADAYKNRRAEVDESATSLADSLKRDMLRAAPNDDALTESLLNAAAQRMAAGHDKTYGGFGSAPKFPQPMNLEFLLRAYSRTKNTEWLRVVIHTLEQMARGGIYDQIGGGFHRYSTDVVWLVPHFEKMLYDNAQLSRVYLHAYQITGNLYFREIAEQVYDYILREMTSAEGGFYSTTDADSEGEEGKFFVWQRDELESLLNEDAIIAIEYYGATTRGNFEGANILYIPADDDHVANRLGISRQELRSKIEHIRKVLYAAREKREHPGLDDKILTAWNGMMLASLAEGARVLKRDDYRAAAEKNAAFLLEKLAASDGRLLRTYKDGVSKLNAYLEDYGNLIDGLLELYQTTFDLRWFSEARRLADHVLEHFPATDGGFYDTSDDHEALIVRPRALQDNATPSGGSMIARQFVRLAAYTGDARYEKAARGVLNPMAVAMEQVPQAIGEALNAAEMLVSGVREVAIVGDALNNAVRSLLDVIRIPYRPNMVVALSPHDEQGEASLPLLSYRTQRDGLPTVYVCRNFTCLNPVTTAEELNMLLES